MIWDETSEARFRMMICHNPPIVFVHIPKTAGTSIAQMLAPHCAKAPDTRLRRIARKLHIRQNPNRAHFRSHDGAAQVKSAFGAQAYARYDVFSVVRNPFDHAVSHYTYLREFPDDKVRGTVSQMDFATYLRNRIAPSTNFPRAPFARMMDQFSFLCDAKENLIVDTIFDFSDVAIKLPVFLSQRGLTVAALPHARKTTGRRGAVADFYNDETTELVRNLYQRDFDAFGYHEDPGNADMKPVKGLANV